jgi:hypothetical protein
MATGGLKRSPSKEEKTESTTVVETDASKTENGAKSTRMVVLRFLRSAPPYHKGDEAAWPDSAKVVASYLSPKHADNPIAEVIGYSQPENDEG